MKLITFAFTICLLAASAIGGWVLFGFKPNRENTLMAIFEFVFLASYFGIISRAKLEVEKEVRTKARAISGILMPLLSLTTQMVEIIYNKVERDVLWDDVSQTYIIAHGILLTLTSVCVILGILSWYEYKAKENIQQMIQLSEVVVLPINVSQPVLIQQSPAA